MPVYDGESKGNGKGWRGSGGEHADLAISCMDMSRRVERGGGGEKGREGRDGANLFQIC